MNSFYGNSSIQYKRVLPNGNKAKRLGFWCCTWLNHLDRCKCFSLNCKLWFDWNKWKCLVNWNKMYYYVNSHKTRGVLHESRSQLWTIYYQSYNFWFSNESQVPAYNHSNDDLSWEYGQIWTEPTDRIFSVIGWRSIITFLYSIHWRIKASSSSDRPTTSFLLILQVIANFGGAMLM